MINNKYVNSVQMEIMYLMINYHVNKDQFRIVWNMKTLKNVLNVKINTIYKIISVYYMIKYKTVHNILQMKEINVHHVKRITF